MNLHVLPIHSFVLGKKSNKGRKGDLVQMRTEQWNLLTFALCIFTGFCPLL